MLTSFDIRNKFLSFFANKQHTVVRSSSLIPHNDPTLLFTNAGMNQFKDYFLDNEKPPYNSATTAQKVLRAGGKHNDLENVGYTARHQTFFEMLGNFSFCAYGKKEAIEFAWEFLTKELGLEKEKLGVSVYEKDIESYKIWNETIGVPADAIAKLGAKDNFWTMGSIGPCGPCAEIHYLVAPLENGKTKKDSLEADDGCLLEIWNLVFMESSQKEDGTIEPLPRLCVDTGMGLERITSVMQNVTSNYDTDLFKPLIHKIAQAVKYTYGTDKTKDVACRVIADHLRATFFLLADGVFPSNEGAGYVLRRIIRRAARYGRELGYKCGFFSELAPALLDSLGEVYPELTQEDKLHQTIVKQEEFRFNNTLQQGLHVLENLIKENPPSNKVLDGEKIFRLYDTYGFPAELATEYLHDRNLTFDHVSYQKAMQEQKDRAKAAHVDSAATLKVDPFYHSLSGTYNNIRFIGYETLNTKTNVLALIKDKQSITKLKQNDIIEVLLEETPFYAESGGQIGDQGIIENQTMKLQVLDTYKPLGSLILCKAKVVFLSQENETINLPCTVTAQVNQNLRLKTASNHTLAHLLQAALKHLLGEHVKQAGSLVTPNKMRFDFTHYTAVTPQEINQIEEWIQTAILSNTPVETTLMTLEEAMESGATALFDEKYGDKVRVVHSNNYTKELCGGTHVKQLGDIGTIKIVSEESIAAGTRRIEAISGIEALRFIQDQTNLLQTTINKLKTTPSALLERLDQTQAQIQEKDKQIQQLQKQVRRSFVTDTLALAKPIQSISFVSTLVQDSDLRSFCSLFQEKMENGIILVGYQHNNQITVAISVNPSLTKQISAGNLIKEFASLLDGKGGGKPDFGQCGGSNPDGWHNFVTNVEQKIASILA